MSSSAVYVGNKTCPHNFGIEYRYFGCKEQQGGHRPALYITVECWFLQGELSGNVVPVSLLERPR